MDSADFFNPEFGRDKQIYGGMNTNERRTVEELITFLQRFPSGSHVWGYEGEGGSWIMCEGPVTLPRSR